MGAIHRNIGVSAAMTQAPDGVVHQHAVEEDHGLAVAAGVDVVDGAGRRFDGGQLVVGIHCCSWDRAP